ncbi:hypothetical protein GNI_112910 [Gregarina niphandrodes]|uniref:Uncharacterized protein n=1 Tax=Gregarina niphandrodes TaxID=110365 RepID=A0A023B3B4_GRENI|nr:hypothetical protein GNI_112910 [Gregarina niphandrodes]EZG55450.1 hypothetical protein GNI_112910 [Gregarina niphandrodes]|eukprot:XP_011131550.1 hypothetical protein GNI_112910 [Gregarina niphandrodes]
MGTVAQFQLEWSSHQVVAIFDQRKCEEVFVGGQGGESFSIRETWLEDGEKPSHFILHHPTYSHYVPIVHTFHFEDGNPEEENPEEENRRQDNREGSRQACPNPQVSLYPDYPLVKDFPNPVLVVTVRKGFFTSRTIVDAVPLSLYLVKDGLRIQIEACGDLGLVHIACVRRGRGGRNKLLHRTQIDTSLKPIQVILEGTDQLMRATHLTYEVEGHCAGFTAQHSPITSMRRPFTALMVPESVNKNTFDDERFCI